MNGGSLSLVMSRPLMAPQTSPRPMPASRARNGEVPALTMRVAETIPTKLAIEPTARSMPPVMMTNVMPSPMMALTLAETAMSRRLPEVRKFGFSIPKMRKMTTAAM